MSRNRSIAVFDLGIAQPITKGIEGVIGDFAVAGLKILILGDLRPARAAVVVLEGLLAGSLWEGNCQSARRINITKDKIGNRMTGFRA